MWLASAVVPVHSVSEHPPPAFLSQRLLLLCSSFQEQG